MKFSRKWAMPNKNTFSVLPIGEFVEKYLSQSKSSVDPFARNFAGADITNDLNPETKAMHHMKAQAFLKSLVLPGTNKIDLVIFDPPYSPRQISECYKGIGLEVTGKDTQNAALYKACRDKIDELLLPDGIVLSFGWNSNGMGKTRGYEILEIMIVAHGGGHNDTICMAERKSATLFEQPN